MKKPNDSNQLSQAELMQIVKERDEYRLSQLVKGLNQLGFTFANNAGLHQFISERLSIVKAKDSPGIERIYLDHEKPTEAFLAEFNNNAVLRNGQVLFHDSYSCEDHVA